MRPAALISVALVISGCSLIGSDGSCRSAERAFVTFHFRQIQAQIRDFSNPNAPLVQPADAPMYRELHEGLAGSLEKFKPLDESTSVLDRAIAMVYLQARALGDVSIYSTPSDLKDARTSFEQAFKIVWESCEYAEVVKELVDNS